MGCMYGRAGEGKTEPPMTRNSDDFNDARALVIWTIDRCNHSIGPPNRRNLNDEPRYRDRGQQAVGDHVTARLFSESCKGSRRLGLGSTQ